MANNGNGRVYRPQRTFDDDLVDLAGFFSANELSLDGLDAAKLNAVGVEQRDSRADDARLLGAYKAHHEAFIREQRARHVLYTQALDYAHAKFKANPAKLAELERFRRRMTRNGSTPREPQAEPARGA